MTTATLDTQTLTPGNVVNVDGKVDGVFIGELPKRNIFSKHYGDHYVFIYDASSKSAGEAIAECRLKKSTTSFDGERVSTNGESVSTSFYYPKNPTGETDTRYYNYLKLLQWAGIKTC